MFSYVSVRENDRVGHFGDAVCRRKRNESSKYLNPGVLVCRLITTCAGVGWSPQQRHGMGRGILKKNFEGGYGYDTFYVISYGSLGVR